MELTASKGFQGDLLASENLPETSAMMSVLDQVNQRFGRQMLKPGLYRFSAYAVAYESAELKP